MKKLDLNENVKLVESLLNDMCYNPDSYTTSLRGTREFKDGYFYYTFK